MPGRRFALSNKKLRGIPRRLRALKRWRDEFQGYFPNLGSDIDGYWNVKIPVHLALVEGRQTNEKIQAECAQAMIDAAYSIYQAKPETESTMRVTCSIVLPSMFASELCIYTSESYFKEHTTVGDGRFGKISLLDNRSLCKEWGLELPKGFSELGVSILDEDDEGNPFYQENWFFGELSEK